MHSLHSSPSFLYDDHNQFINRSHTMHKDTAERRINVPLDRETHRKLRMEAVELDRPMNALAREVLKQHFSKEQRNNEN